MAPVRKALVLVAAASVALVPNLTTGAASGAA